MMFSKLRDSRMIYRSCGRSGLKLPAIALGLWHNFSTNDDYSNAKEMLRIAFDLGINHFDLANNYGTPPGSAEITLGQILKKDFVGYRDELIISTKAGYDMWPGPNGIGGSRKHLLASINQSLTRLGLDYVDIFYHHCPDPETPMEETVMALDQIVRSGKALYVGISSYSSSQTKQVIAMLKSLGTPCLVHQAVYNLFNRNIEKHLLAVVEKEKIGCVVFSPLSQGLLTNRYLNGIPKDSRAAKPSGFLRPESVTAHRMAIVKKLESMADKRGQTMAQMALAWVLRQPMITSAIIGASKADQIIDCVGVLKGIKFSEEELQAIDQILVE